MPKLPALPIDIPASPQKVYKKTGWDCWGDWLGTDFRSSKFKTFRDFISARSFVRQLNLRNGQEWRLFTKGTLPGQVIMPDDIPANPDTYYSRRGKWISWSDWLGDYVAPKNGNEK
jgi:hypothetical protein